MTTGPSNHTIVRAAEPDLPAIAALATVIWRACYRQIISDEQIDYMLARMYSIDTMREEIQREGIRYEQLLLDGELTGFAAYGPAGQPGIYKLHKLYLQPARHGQGLGSLLLRHCENEVRRAGAHRLVLNVNKRNPRAIGVYQKHGFQITHPVVLDIGGGFVMDDYVMAKDLIRSQSPRGNDRNRAPRGG